MYQETEIDHFFGPKKMISQTARRFFLKLHCKFLSIIMYSIIYIYLFRCSMLWHHRSPEPSTSDYMKKGDPIHLTFTCHHDCIRQKLDSNQPTVSHFRLHCGESGWRLPKRGLERGHDKRIHMGVAPCTFQVAYVPWLKVAIRGIVIQPWKANPYNGYINLYYWVDEFIP